MKPRPINYILSHAFWISAGGGALIAILIVTVQYLTSGILRFDAKHIAFALLAYVPAGLIGFILGIFPGWMLVGNIVSKFQGAPFRAGDMVCILSGKQKGTITTVYEVWDSRGQVRVDLGDELKESVEDVYCNVAVYKMKETEQEDSNRPADAAD